MEQDNLEHTEIRIKGVAVSQGIAIGPAFVLGADHSEIKASPFRRALRSVRLLCLVPIIPKSSYVL